MLNVLCGLLWNCTDTPTFLDGAEGWSFGGGCEVGRRASCSDGRAARALKAIFADGRQETACFSQLSFMDVQSQNHSVGTLSKPSCEQV